MPDLTSVIRAGQTIASLEALRDSIAADLDACESMRDKATLYARLSGVLIRIEAMRPPESVGDVVDEIAARRTSRRPGAAAGSPRAKRPG